MKILVASFDEVPSFKGAATHILCGLRRIIPVHDVTLVSLGDVALPKQRHFRHLPLALREGNYLRRALLFRREFSKILLSVRPDLVHARSAWEALPAIQLGYPVILEINGLASVELRYRYRSITEPVLRMLRSEESACIHGAHSIISPSTIVRDYLVTLFGPEVREKITVLPNGYDPVPRQEPSFSRLSEEQTFPLRLVYVGTLSSWQGITWSLKALRDFESRVTLDLFTPTLGPQRKFFERRVRRLGLESSVKIHPPLHRQALAKAIQGYDLGFAPLLKTERNTEQGGYPIKILDYLASGLPVVASDLRLNRQLLDAQDSFLFAPNSGVALRSALLNALENPNCLAKKKLAVAAKLSQCWTWNEYSDALAKLYGSYFSPLTKE